MTNFLTSCPGCGKFDTIQPEEILEPYSVRYSCTCGWSGPANKFQDKAFLAWNTRSPELHWRRELPDVPGLWLRRSLYGDLTIETIYATDVSTFFKAKEPNEFHWAGPIHVSTPSMRKLYPERKYGRF